jgi:N-acetylglutamate synthase
MPLVFEATWVGRRVVVRYGLERTDLAGAKVTDAVGDLVELDDRIAVVETRSGRVQIARHRVVAAKLIAPSTAEILALEAIAERGWRAAETADIGGWLLRANSGFTGRANSALPLRQPTQTLEDTLASARAWYAARGLPFRVQVPLPARRDLEVALAERGFAADADVQVLTGRLDILRRAGAHARGEPADVYISVTDQPNDDWLAEYRQYRGRPVPAAGVALLSRHPRVAFVALQQAETIVAIGRGAVDDGWLGTAVEVAASQRHAGHGTATMRALWEWAATEHGATRGYLQVSADNSGGLGFYQRLGYAAHHSYRYQTDPATERA